MKNRQVGIFLVALIIVGALGLIVRIISSSEDEIVLAGLAPLEREFIDKVVIKSPESEATLVRNQETWYVNSNQPVFIPKINEFWEKIQLINGAGLIALNETNHERMGVSETGTQVSLFLGGAVQEQFVVGTWNQDVRLCYVRRAGKNPVYGIECSMSSNYVFDSRPDGWRDPIIVAIPPTEIQELVFSYPDQQFLLKLDETGWKAVNAEEEVEVDPILIQPLVGNIQGILAVGFASKEEAEELTFNNATPSVRIVTRPGATQPTTRIRFLPRDDETSYVKTGSHSTVYIVDIRIAELLLQPQTTFGLSQND